MNYIYDIVLNFNTNYYDFFEWNKDDKIINIKKIPIIKVCDKDYLNLKYNNIKVTSNILNLIENKTLIYGNTNYKYVMIVTNSKEAFAVLLKNDGKISKRSSLIIDEEDEVLELSDEIEFFDIEYEIIEKCESDFVCRIEREKKNKIIKNLKNIYNSNDLVLMKYLYYEYFEKEEEDIDKIYNELLCSLDEEWNMKQYEFLKLINLIKVK